MPSKLQTPTVTTTCCHCTGASGNVAVATKARDLLLISAKPRKASCSSFRDSAEMIVVFCKELPQPALRNRLSACDAFSEAQLCEIRRNTYERTNRSRLTQSGFFGLKVMNLLNTTWATGAMPMGAPGWPELAWNVASTCKAVKISN